MLSRICSLENARLIFCNACSHNTVRFDVMTNTVMNSGHTSQCSLRFREHDQERVRGTYFT